MRTIGAAILATALVVSNAFADSRPLAPLPAGKPAGVKDAAMLGPNLFLVFISAGIIIGGITFAVSNSKSGVTTPSTSSTSTTGLP